MLEARTNEMSEEIRHSVLVLSELLDFRPVLFLERLALLQKEALDLSIMSGLHLRPPPRCLGLGLDFTLREARVQVSLAFLFGETLKTSGSMSVRHHSHDHSRSTTRDVVRHVSDGSFELKIRGNRTTQRQTSFLEPREVSRECPPFGSHFCVSWV